MCNAALSDFSYSDPIWSETNQWNPLLLLNKFKLICLFSLFEHEARIIPVDIW